MAASAEPAAAPLPPPTGLKRRRIAVGSSDQYEETPCHLGAGAFGSVTRGRHRATGRPVAIKRLSDGGGGPAALLREARFLEEASAGNPYVVGFEAVVRVPGTMDLRLVMELVGPTLHDVLRRHRPRGGSPPPPVPEAAVRAAMWQLPAGAEGMHAAGVVHRDIKPQNILVGDGHRVLKLCDLGLAVSTSEPPPYDPVGTLWYKAPEVLLEKPDHGAPVDAWSLGCVMAELLNGGEPLFQGSDEQGQVRAIFDELGAPDDGAWPWFSSTAFATVAAPDLDMRRCNLLREVFPETKLSMEGFEVLSGLLTCNPDKRLTAAAALKLPWFAKIDALELPKNEEVEWPLPKRRRLRVLCA